MVSVMWLVRKVTRRWTEVCMKSRYNQWWLTGLKTWTNLLTSWTSVIWTVCVLFNWLSNEGHENSCSLAWILWRTYLQHNRYRLLCWALSPHFLFPGHVLASFRSIHRVVLRWPLECRMIWVWIQHWNQVPKETSPHFAPGAQDQQQGA